MEEKAYIVIDDIDQEQLMDEHIDVIIRRSGYKVRHFYYNPADRDFWNEAREFDITKFVEKIAEDIRGHHINAIACDYEFSGVEGQNGLSIIYALRTSQKTRKLQCPVVLYSGKEQKVISDLLASENHQREKIQSFIELLKCKISLFVKREGYPSSIIDILKNSYEIKDIVLKKLSEVPDLTLRFGNDYFEGKTVEELIQEISADSLHANRLIGELLEIAIAHFLTINEDGS